tara:strand:+ start:784 stop:984 length:201 start_codon:yes stop_codon:yes gene_type:complete
VVSFTGDHLGSGVAWTTACGFEHFTLLIHVREAKVDYLDVVLVIEEQVLRLEVTMADAHLMDVFYT